LAVLRTICKKTRNLKTHGTPARIKLATIGETIGRSVSKRLSGAKDKEKHRTSNYALMMKGARNPESCRHAESITSAVCLTNERKIRTHIKAGYAIEKMSRFCTVNLGTSVQGESLMRNVHLVRTTLRREFGSRVSKGTKES